MQFVKKFLHFLRTRAWYIKLMICFIPVFLSAALMIGYWKQLKPKAPAVTSFNELPQHQSSFINIPILIEIKHLEDKINEKIKGKINKNVELEGDGDHKHEINIYKLDRIKLSMQGDEVKLVIPLKVEIERKARKRFFASRKNKEPKNNKLEFSLNLHVKGTYKINPQWQVITQSEIEKIEWIQKPKINIGLFKISIAGIVEKKLRKQEEFILDQLNETARTQINLKKTVTKIWQDIQKPILLNSKMKTIWLLANPVDLAMSPVRCDGKHIIINAGITSEIQTVFGGKPEKINFRHTPSLKFRDLQKDIFNINLKGVLTFDDINQILADSLNGKSMVIKNHKVKITNSHMYGTGDNLILRLDIKGDAKGRIFFKGKPAYDERTQTLKLENFNFDMHTEEVLLKVANWLFHEDFRDQIQQMLHLPLGPTVEQIPDLISQALNKGKMGNKISINIKTLELHPTSIVVRPEGIHTSVNVKGKAGIDVDKL
jgi:hypothetical protein